MTEKTTTPRELALGGLFGAAALALPFVFHLLQLGKAFLPMYLPLMALAFFVRPGVAAATGFSVPLLSALLTGMPPWYPPIAPVMAIELSLMAAAASALGRRRPKAIFSILIPVLLAGRLCQFGAWYLLGFFLELPPEMLSIAALLAGLPGIVLMLIVIPLVVRAISAKHRPLEQST